MRLESQPQNSTKVPLTDPNIASLIGKISRKEAAAMTALYDATSRFLFGLASHILQDPAGAEEILLDVYTQVWKQASSYDPKRSTPLTWMTAITRTRAIDRLRSGKHGWKPEFEETAGTVKPPAKVEKETPVGSEYQKLVWTAIGKLPPEQRSVIELAYYSGLSQSEIAAQLRQPLGAIRTRARLGLLKLGDLLRPIIPGSGTTSEK
jgi:RNA polymerase sigma-70 factor (ECF subfamily)